jgi:hypothetical protein
MQPESVVESMRDAALDEFSLCVDLADAPHMGAAFLLGGAVTHLAHAYPL